MNQAKLAKILKIIIIFMCICGAVVYLGILPFYGKDFLGEGVNRFYTARLIFLWLTAIPVIVAMVNFWKIVKDIEGDKSFTGINALRLKRIATLAIIDVGYYFIGNIVFLFLKGCTWMMFGFSLVIDVIGIAVSIAAALLSHLVTKAAVLREESELTI